MAPRRGSHSRDSVSRSRSPSCGRGHLERTSFWAFVSRISVCGSSWVRRAGARRSGAQRRSASPQPRASSWCSASGRTRATVSRRLQTSWCWRRSGSLAVIIEPEDGPSALTWADQASLVLTPIAPKAEFGVATQPETFDGGIPVRSIGSLPLRGGRAALEREHAQIVREIGKERPFAASPVITSALPHRGPHPIGAAFTVSTLEMLALAGASSVSFAAPTGWGVIRRRKGGHEVVTPAYHVLADVGDCRFGQVGLLDCSTRKRWPWRVSTRWTVSAFSWPM